MGLGRGLNLDEGGDALRRELFAQLQAGDTGAVLPTREVLRPWFEELAVDGEEGQEEGQEEEEEEEEEEQKEGGRDDVAKGRRVLPAAAVEALLRRAWAHAEPAFAGSAPLRAAARRAFEDVLGDCVAEAAGSAPMNFRSFVDNPFGCVHEALWKLLRQDDDA